MYGNRIRTDEEIQAALSKHRREHDDICLGGESCEFCRSTAATLARMDLLEAFALEALNHLNIHLWDDPAVKPETKSALLEDARDFVQRHCNDGSWTLENIQVNQEYVDWGGDG